MTKLQAAAIASELEILGFKTEIEDRGENRIDEDRYQVRGHAKFSSVIFYALGTAEGFINGIRFALSNLARPSIY